MEMREVAFVLNHVLSMCSLRKLLKGFFSITFNSIHITSLLSPLVDNDQRTCINKYLLI